MIPTPHIEAKSQADIASVVLMPGDPLRAKFISDEYLTDVICFNKVRGMLGFTGTFKGKKITVMGSGMGMPSIGIYSYELFKFYDVKTIIRVGSCGAYAPELNIYDCLLAESAYSESTYGSVQNGDNSLVRRATPSVNQIIIDQAKDLNTPLKVGVIHSSDVFYQENNQYKKLYQNEKCLAVEMESFALFHNANLLGKNAACLLTVSDSLVTHQATTSEERQTAFRQMIELALGAAIKL